MTIKAEVKYKVIFHSKCENHSSQIEEKHVLSRAIRSFWFCRDIRFFRKKLLNFDVANVFTVECVPCFEKCIFQKS